MLPGLVCPGASAENIVDVAEDGRQLGIISRRSLEIRILVKDFNKALIVHQVLAVDR